MNYKPFLAISLATLALSAPCAAQTYSYLPTQGIYSSQGNGRVRQGGQQPAQLPVYTPPATIAPQHWGYRGTDPGFDYNHPPVARNPYPQNGQWQQYHQQSYPPIIAYPIVTEPVTQPSYPYPWNGPYPGPMPNPYAPQYTAPGTFYPYPTPPVTCSPPVEIYAPGYYYPYYCPSDYGNYVYPSVYGLYIGFPGYFYAPEQSVTVLPNGSLVYNNVYGTIWYSFGDGGFIAEGALPYQRHEHEHGEVPRGLRRPFDDIAQAWSQHNESALAQYLPSSGRIQVGLNGSYAYSIAPQDYRLMTIDAMQRLQTTGFQFTNASVQPNGDVTGYAVQDYRAPTGDASKMYVSYTLRPDSSQAGGYRIVGVGASTHPFSAGQHASVARPSSGKSATHVAQTNSPRYAPDITYHN